MSNRRLYVGNLSYSTLSDGLSAFFASAGEVQSAEVINHKNGRSKGFGFVEMATEEGAQAAVAELNGKMLDGRPIRVDLAKPKTEGDSAPRQDRNGGYRSERGYNSDRGSNYERGNRGDRYNRRTF